ncbi:MAG: glycosyltransferase family 2 protein [Chloroflexi bacterium]|nr:glycosyltransferase family 2 protein [Chloroflexota bacterium]
MITFVVVSYNTCAYLERCLATLPGPTIVVDNASTDGSAELATIRNERNLGFGMAANIGIKAAVTPWIFLLNPDVQLLPTSLPPLLAATQDSRVGIIGPSLISQNGDGRRQRSTFPDPTLWRAVKRHLFFAETIAARFSRLRKSVETSEVSVDWLLGAAMLIRRECWAQIGGFDESIFLYGEDWDFCYRARQAGWRVLFAPEAQVIHHGNAAGETFGEDRLTRVTLSELYVIEKHYGARQAQAHRLLATLGSALRAPFSEKHRRLLKALLIGSKN